MEKDVFPIWVTMQHWPKFYHFFHFANLEKETHLGPRKIADSFTSLLVLIKLSMISVVISRFPDGKINTFFGKLLDDLVTLQFLNPDYTTAITFAFMIIVTSCLIYYYNNIGKMFLHHMTFSINFTLQQVSPLMSYFSASCIHKYSVGFYNGTRNYTFFTFSIISYFAFAFFSFLGCIFRTPKHVKNCISHSFWNHIDAFIITQVPNLLQQLWILEDVFKYGIHVVLISNFLFTLFFLYNCRKFMFLDEFSNIFAINIYGVTSFILIASILYVFGLISVYITWMIYIGSIFIWFMFLGRKIFNYYCYQVVKRTKFNPDYLIDLEKQIRLPDVKPQLLIRLLRYLVCRNFKDVQAMLIAAIDSDRNINVTIDCAKILMVHAGIPNPTRIKLNNIDIKEVKFIRRCQLCEIQYYIDRRILTQDDCNWSIQLIEEMNQKVKVALYAFTNCLCEGLKSDKLIVKAMNYAILTQTLIDLAEYSIAGNPLSLELNQCYSDFLTQIGGDFIRNYQLHDRAREIKMSFIKSDDSSHLFFNENKFKFNKRDPFMEQNTTYQKTLDSVPKYMLRVLIGFASVLGFLMLFPILSINWFETSGHFSPDEYFAHYHSPAHFKTYLAIENILLYLKYLNYSREKSVYDEFRPIGIYSLRRYLNSVICIEDGNPIFDGSGNDIGSFPDFYIQFRAQKNIFTTRYDDSKLHLWNSHIEIVRMNGFFDELMDRYLRCTKDIKYEQNYNQFFACFSSSLIVMILFFINLLYFYKRSLLKIINVYAGIELPTLEEFRSKLFVQISHQTLEMQESIEVDNEGALDLEEIEDDGAPNHIASGDYTDLVDQSLKSPIALKWYDPARVSALIVYILILFIIRYSIAVGAHHIYNYARRHFIASGIVIQEDLNKLSKVLIQIDEMLANITGIKEAHPVRLSLANTSSRIEYIYRRWNVYVNQRETFSPEYQMVLLNGVLDLGIPLLDEYLNKFPKFSDSNAKYGQEMHWFNTILIFLLYFLVCFRFFTTHFYIIKNLKNLVMILHSKYAATVSILVNEISLETADKDFDIDYASLLIARNLREVSIMFDKNLHITAINQQATAQLGFNLLDGKTVRLESILPPEKNCDFYSFLLAMNTAYGVRSKRHFEFVVNSARKEDDGFTGTLIPLLDSVPIKYAITMRSTAEILEMKNDLEFLEKTLINTLKRLVPQNIVQLMISDKMPRTFVSKGSAVLAVTLKRSNMYDGKSTILNLIDTTQVCISLIDRVLLKFPTIARLRSFSGNFLFVSSLFDEEEQEDANSAILTMLQFANDIATEINTYMRCEYLVTGIMSYGGPVMGSLTGITKMLFDVFGLPLVECFDYLDFSPDGKMLFINDAYEQLNDKSKLIPFTPPQQINKQLWLLKSYVGLNFSSDDERM